MTDISLSASEPATKPDIWNWLYGMNVFGASVTAATELVLLGSGDTSLLRTIGAVCLAVGVIAYKPENASDVAKLKTDADAQEIGAAHDEIAAARARHRSEIEEITERLAKPSGAFAP